MAPTSWKQGEDDAEGSNHDRHGDRPSGGRTVNLLGGSTVMLCMAVYLLHRTMLPLERWEFGKAHLHDLMAMPILLGWIDLIADHRSPTARRFTTPFATIALTLVGIVAWEVLDPLVDSASVADPIDALCYAAGAMAYVLAKRVLTSGTATSATES